MGNPWLDHVQNTRKANPSKSFKEALILAKKTYKKMSGENTLVKKKTQTKRKTKKKTQKKRKTKKNIKLVVKQKNVQKKH